MKGGTVEWRPKGTAGEFELCRRGQSGLIFEPGLRLHHDEKAPAYLFLYEDMV